MQHLPILLVVCVVCTSRKKGPDRYIHPVCTNLPCGKSTLSREGILNFYGRSRSSAETQRGHAQRGRKGLIARTADEEEEETQGSTCLLYAILLNGSKNVEFLSEEPEANRREFVKTLHFHEFIIISYFSSLCGHSHSTSSSNQLNIESVDEKNGSCVVL